MTLYFFLLFNLDKSKFISFAPNLSSFLPQSFTIFAHNCSTYPSNPCSCPLLLHTDCTNHLGVLIDNTLSWKSQIQAICTRICKLIFVFEALRTLTKYSTLVNFFFTLG